MRAPVVALARHRRQFAYDRWANGEFVRALAAIEVPPPAAVRRLAHIAAAESLWLERILGEPQSMAVWPELDTAGIAEVLDQVEKGWRAYLDELTEAELERVIRYVNTKGESFESRIDDVLTHVVVHSAHHRGQIAADLRTAGVDPPYTDFIQATRTGVV